MGEVHIMSYKLIILMVDVAVLIQLFLSGGSLSHFRMSKAP